jgi:hypothetical protein
MKQRRRFKQIHTLEERLSQEAKALRKRARQLPPGQAREALLRKARNDESAAHLTQWLMSPSLPRSE